MNLFRFFKLFHTFKLFHRGVVLLAVGFTASACAAKIGVGAAPEPISVPEAALASPALSGLQVSVAPVLDARMPGALAESESASSRVEAEGDVDGIVANALRKAFNQQAAGSGSTQSVTIKTEIRDWYSTVSAAAVGKIESVAVLAVEAVGSDGRRLFSGTYNGSRASSFPVVGKQDVQQSLSLAMSEAITQMLNDQNFVQSIRSAETSEAYY